MSAPRFVNTTDGTCWSRREATRDGEPLYALASCEGCPELVMATYAELAEHGIAGTADVLPVPVGPQTLKPLSELEALRAQVAELNESVSTAAEALRATATQALPWAHEMPDADLSMFLDDLVSAAMNRWRTDPDGPVPDRVTLADIERVCADWRTPGEGLRGDEPETADAVTQVFAPVASPREADVTPQVQKLRSLLAGQRAVLEDPHDSPLHHPYRLGHDLPETGAAGESA